MQRTLEDPLSQVKALALSPDGLLLASGCDDTIQLWHVATGVSLQTLKYPSEVLAYTLAVYEMVFSLNDRLLMSRFSDTSRRMIADLTWDTETDKLLQTDEDLNEAITRSLVLGPGLLVFEATKTCGAPQ